MNQHDFGVLVKDIGNVVNPFNHLIYQIVILIALYNLISRISFKNISRHRSFIILFSVMVIAIDWFIWNDIMQTIIFAVVLYIYITYHYNNYQQLETFLDIIKNQKQNNKQITNDNKKKIKKQNELLEHMTNMETKQKQELEKMIYNPAPCMPQKEPASYSKLGTNDLRVAYKSDAIEQVITDSKFADTMLNALYGSSQYKNIKPQCTDELLLNNIHMSPEEVVPIDVFRHTKKEFLDNKWLQSKDYKYNDNCPPQLRDGSTRRKNAICSLVGYGNELSECTNQEVTITKAQLDSISNNHLEPIYKC
jgi:Ca2+/Na+ antiporter